MVSRRTILKASIATGAVVAFSGSIAGLSAFAQNSPRIRRSLHDMALDDPDLSTYRDFVGMMLAKDQKDPVSWLQYSLMHGKYRGNYRYCPHGDWYFLPWHREFVLMYENAARTLTGNDSFAMPYWDWTVDRVMPKAFTDETYNGKANPLYVKGRTLNTNDWPLSDDWVSQAVLDSKVFDETNFQFFGTSKNPDQDNLDMSWVVKGGGVQGFLEGTPHNLIHNAIGAYMPSAGSPRDPIFMMHHGNIDRIWAVWNALGRSNTGNMSQTDQTLWLDMNFKNNYLSPTGQTYSATPANLQSTLELGYTYPDLPAPDNLSSDPVRDAKLLSLLAAGSKSDKLDVLRVLPAANTEAATLSKPLVKSVRFSSAMSNQVALTAPADAAEVFVIIREMDVGPNVSSVRVFVNAETLTSKTPNSDPHFAGEIGILSHPESSDGEHSGHHKAPPTALIDLTDTLRTLAKKSMLKGDNISVQLIPVLRNGMKDGNDAKVIPAVIEIVVI